MNNTSCIFCRIVRGEIPAKILLQNEQCMIIQDIAPKADIHWLVVPKVHLDDLRIATPSHQALLGATLLAAAEVVRNKADNRPFKLVANNGHEAGQRVLHLHFHILIGTFLGSIAEL